MMSGVTSFYEKMNEWQGDMPAAPFTADTFKFIQEIGGAAKLRPSSSHNSRDASESWHLLVARAGGSRPQLLLG